jgi:hypothetical protein
VIQIRPGTWRAHHQITAGILVLLLACPAWSYDFPLTSSAIRDAYFLGTRQAGMGDDFLAQYTHSVPQLRLGDNLVTRIRIETPFLQVAAHASKTLNYNAQNAVKDFYGKPAVFRMYLEICYMLDAPLPNAVKVTVLQNDKEITPRSDERSAFFPATDPYIPAVNVGEIVNQEFDPRKFDSSTLTVRIDTPDDQHAKTEFDLQTLR